MRAEVFDKLSDRLYRENNSSFLLLVNSFTRGGMEGSVKKLVEKLYDFSANLPYPEKFILESAEQHLCKDGFENTLWAKKLNDSLNERLNSFLSFYDGCFISKRKKDKEMADILTEERNEISQMIQRRQKGG